MTCFSALIREGDSICCHAEECYNYGTNPADAYCELAHTGTQLFIRKIRHTSSRTSDKTRDSNA